MGNRCLVILFGASIVFGAVIGTAQRRGARPAARPQRAPAVKTSHGSVRSNVKRVQSNYKSADPRVSGRTNVKSVDTRATGGNNFNSADTRTSGRNNFNSADPRIVDAKIKQIESATGQNVRRPVRTPGRPTHLPAHVVDRLPDGAKEVIYRRKHEKNKRYYCHYNYGRWRWYEPYYDGQHVYYEEVSAPEGAQVDKLPDNADEVTVDDEIYYVSGKDFYKKNDEGYEVAEAVKIPPPKREKSEKANAMLKGMFEHYAGIDSFAMEATELRGKGYAKGMLTEGTVTRRTYLKKPNKFRTRVTTKEGMNRQFWYNGKEAILYDGPRNIYSGIDGVPDTLIALMEKLEAEYNASFPLSDIIFEDAYEVIEGDMAGSEYRGVREIDGVKCHWLVFYQTTVDWQLWLPVEGPPRYKQIAIKYRDEPDAPVFAVKVKKWLVPDPDAAADAYDFKPPDRAARVGLKARN